MPVLRLKDGTRLRVKEGADYEGIVKKYMASQRAADPEFQAKVAAQQAADKEEYNPTKGMSGVDKFRAGMGEGMTSVARGVGNMVGLVDDQTIDDARERDAALLETGAGKAGSFVGNVAATSAATAPLGAALSGLRGAGALAHTLRAGAGNVAAQGALAGAINAKPNQRGSGAALGAALGAGTYGALKGIGRLGSGLIQKSADALDLERQLPGTEIPLHTSGSSDDAGSRLAKVIYGVAREAPVSGSMLRKQDIHVLDSFVGEVGKRSVPKVLGLDDLKFTSGQSPAQRASNQANMRVVNDEIGKVFTPLKDKVFARNGQFWNATVGKLLGDGKKVGGLARSNQPLYLEIQKIIDDVSPPHVGSVSGEGILRIMVNLRKLRSKLGGTSGTGSAKQVDDVIKSFEEMGRLRFSKMNKDLYPTWEKALKLNEELWGWKNFERAAAVAKDGSFDSKALVAGMKGGASSKAQGLMPNQDFIASGERVLSNEAERLGGGFRTSVALGLGAGMATVPYATLAAGAALPLLASKTGQRVLTGSTVPQKMLAEAIRKNPALMQGIASRLVPITSPRGE